jgi:hypothetical protein
MEFAMLSLVNANVSKVDLARIVHRRIVGMNTACNAMRMMSV